MARTIAELPAGSRITDHISLGVIARTFPVERGAGRAGGYGNGERSGVTVAVRNGAKMAARWPHP